jgi:hypothetical protein
MLSGSQLGCASGHKLPSASKLDTQLAIVLRGLCFLLHSAPTCLPAQVAEALMAASVPPSSCMARIMLFTGGPCTEGAGKVVNRDLTEEIRRSGYQAA